MAASYTGQQVEAGQDDYADRQDYGSAGSDRNAMTRSEEQLRVDTEREQVGWAWLRKYVAN